MHILLFFAKLHHVDCPIQVNTIVCLEKRKDEFISCTKKTQPYSNSYQNDNQAGFYQSLHGHFSLNYSKVISPTHLSCNCSCSCRTQIVYKRSFAKSSIFVTQTSKKLGHSSSGNGRRDIGLQASGVMSSN